MYCLIYENKYVYIKIFINVFSVKEVNINTQSIIKESGKKI